MASRLLVQALEACRSNGRLMPLCGTCEPLRSECYVMSRSAWSRGSVRKLSTSNSQIKHRRMPTRVALKEAVQREPIQEMSKEDQPDLSSRAPHGSFERVSDLRATFLTGNVQASEELLKESRASQDKQIEDVFQPAVDAAAHSRLVSQIQRRPIGQQHGQSSIHTQKAVTEFLAQLNYDTDWVSVWYLFGKLKSAVFSSDPLVFRRCHEQLLLHLERLLKASPVDPAALVAPLTSKKSRMSSRSVDMQLVALKYIGRGIGTADLSSVAYVMRKLGKESRNCNVLLKPAISECLRHSLAVVNRARHDIAPKDIVSACYGCFNADLQFPAVMSHTSNVCMSKLDELDNRHLQLLVTMVVSGRERWTQGKGGSHSSVGENLTRSLFKEVLHRISAKDWSLQEALETLLLLSSAKMEMDPEALRLMDAHFSQSPGEWSFRSVFRMAVFYSQQGIEDAKFNFAQRLCSMHHLMTAAECPQFFMALARCGQLSDATMRQIVQYSTQSLEQYSLANLSHLAFFLSIQQVRMRPEARHLAADIAASVARRRKLDSAACAELLPRLEPFDCLSVKEQVRLAKAAFCAVPELSFEQVSRLLRTTHSLYRAAPSSTESAEVGVNTDGQAAKKMGKDLRDERHLLRSVLFGGVMSYDFEAVAKADPPPSVMAVSNVLQVAASLSIVKRGLLKMAAECLKENWRDLLQHRPKVLVLFMHDLSNLQHHVPRTFRAIGKHLDEISRPLEQVPSQLAPDKAYEKLHPSLTEIGPVSQLMIKAVWACILQGHMPFQAIKRLFAITPAEVNLLSAPMARSLFQIHCISVDPHLPASLDGVTMASRALEALREKHRAQRWMDFEKDFKKDMAASIPQLVLTDVLSKDGSRVAAALLLDRDRRLLPWTKPAEAQVRESAKNLAEMGLGACALVPLMPAVSTAAKSTLRLGVTAMTIRALVANGWCVVEVPLEQWYMMGSSESRVRYLDTLSMATGKEEMDPRSGAEFELTGEIKQSRETADVQDE